MTVRITSSGNIIPDDPEADHARLSMQQLILKRCLREKDPQAALRSLTDEVGEYLTRLGHGEKTVKVAPLTSKGRTLEEIVGEVGPEGEAPQHGGNRWQATEQPVALDPHAIWEEQPYTVIQPARRAGGLREWLRAYALEHGGQLTVSGAVAGLLHCGRFVDKRLATQHTTATIAKMTELQRVGRGEYALVGERAA